MAITAKLDPDLEAALTRIASERGQSLEDFVGETLRSYVEYWDEFKDGHPPSPLEIEDEAAFVRAVEEGIAQADRGETIAHEDVVRDIDEILRRHERSRL